MAIKDPRPAGPYFAADTEPMRALKSMIDAVGIANVLYALAHICNAKADHLEENWQDQTGAKIWRKRGACFDDKASTLLFSDD